MMTVKEWLTQNLPGTWAVALIQVDEGSFIGWHATPLHTLEAVKQHEHLPVYTIDRVGMLGVEPAYQSARENGHLDFVVVCEEKVVTERIEQESTKEHGEYKCLNPDFHDHDCSSCGGCEEDCDNCDVCDEGADPACLVCQKANAIY